MGSFLRIRTPSWDLFQKKDLLLGPYSRIRNHDRIPNKKIRTHYWVLLNNRDLFLGPIQDKDPSLGPYSRI